MRTEEEGFLVRKGEVCNLPGADDCFGREVVRGERPRGGGEGSPMIGVEYLLQKICWL